MGQLGWFYQAGAAVQKWVKMRYLLSMRYMRLGFGKRLLCAWPYVLFF